MRRWVERQLTTCLAMGCFILLLIPTVIIGVASYLVYALDYHADEDSD